MADTVEVYSPSSLPEALRLLAEPDVRPLAGGTDAIVKLKDGLWQPRAWVNLQGLRGQMSFIRFQAGEVAIGAMTTFGEMLRSQPLQMTAPLLIQAARTIGGPQIRNMATLGGNMGTASPAADSLPALYALEAQVRIVGLDAEREVPIAEFFRGPGRTALEPGELIGGVRFAAQLPSERFTYEKLGMRAAHAISIASAAVRLAPGKGGWGFQSARIALGAVAPTVVRALDAEAILEAATGIDSQTVQKASVAARNSARPISDIRGSSEYRLAMTENLVRRGLVRLLGPAVWEVTSHA